MSDTLENAFAPRHTHLPHLVRVPVPQQRASWVMETMRYWAAEHGNGGYVVSPFRDYSDPWHPWGCFSWHFRSPDVARKFAVEFSGKIVTRQGAPIF